MSEPDLDALERAARAFVAEVESPSKQDRIASMLGVVAILLGSGAREQALANEPGPYLEPKDLPAVEPRSWSIDGGLPDDFRRTMDAVYRDEYSREAEGEQAKVSAGVAELYASIAPFVRALDAGMERRRVLRTLAWEVQREWGVAATELVRPLWELARW